MNGWRSRLAEGLMTLIAVAVVARLVWGLLGPLLPTILVVLVLCALITGILRGPHANR